MMKPDRPPRHVPRRMCIACRQKTAKRELVRIVRTPQGTIEIDPANRKAGRGAYLCTQESCWETGLKSKRLERALKTELIPEQRAMLLEYIKSLSAEAEFTESNPMASHEGARA